jgi:Uncharacterised protein family (UPF0239)
VVKLANYPNLDMEDIGADIIIEPDDLLSKVIRYGKSFQHFFHIFRLPSYLRKFLFLGLYFGAIFQVVCIGAVIFLKDPVSPNDYSDNSESEASPQLTPKRHHRSRRTDRKQKKR